MSSICLPDKWVYIPGSVTGVNSGAFDETMETIEKLESSLLVLLFESRSCSFNPIAIEFESKLFAKTPSFPSSLIYLSRY